MLPLPDLLARDPHLAIDAEEIQAVLDLAFLGRDIGTQLHDALARAQLPPGTWNPDYFSGDLFLRDLIRRAFTLEVEGRSYPVNQRFLHKVLANAPTDPEVVRMRQEILTEIDEHETIRLNTYRLHKALFDLLSLHKTPSYQANLDVAAFHLDILKQAKFVLDFMESGFGEAQSALHRLHQSALEVKKTEEYRTLANLLDYESGLARLTLDVTVGGDGKIRGFRVRQLDEARSNLFYRNPAARVREQLRLLFNGYPMGNRELMNRLVNEVFRTLIPHLVPLVQLLGQIEVYLTARTFRARAEARGLKVSLADIVDGPASFEGLFNPLLLEQGMPPVPCDIRLASPNPITLVTGPNSGGKTRLLQAIGLAQLLGQSGLYTPAAAARIHVIPGLFVSLVEDESVEQTEGRLGRELVRIRTLFEEMAEGSMVILDELCSGTNPSEGVEVFEMVLRLLRRVEPIAFVTTHFLDYARSLQNGSAIAGLEFLQVEVDDEQRSTYQFQEGVAKTSLAAVTAQRLGVTFERLSRMIQSR